ncbi:MAG: primosomal protein N' [Pseudomonadota bacterium]
MIFQPMMAVIDLLFPINVNHSFRYGWGEGSGSRPDPGTFIEARFGRRKLIGVAWVGRAVQIPSKLVALRCIDTIIDLPPLPSHHLCFVEWMAEYYRISYGHALRLSLNTPQAFKAPPSQSVFALTVSPTTVVRPSKARGRVIAYLEQNPPAAMQLLMKEANVSRQVVQKLVMYGIVHQQRIEKQERPPDKPDPDFHEVPLSSHQAQVLAKIMDAIWQRPDRPILLDGVTGSGKTELYFAVIACMMRRRKKGQILVLLPEIALTAQWAERFRKRFGVEAVLWHSGLTPAARARIWRFVARGEVQLVAGARSSLHLPFCKLDLIIVDEEHDAAFKQDQTVPYQARDMAVVRAKLAGCALVLTSATPSMESEYNVSLGRYHRFTLPTRTSSKRPVAIELVDMRRQGLSSSMGSKRPGEAFPGIISAPLALAIDEVLQQKLQGLLFINRRGYAPLTLCRACGYRFECRNCSTMLVFHAALGRLVCHHCGWSRPQGDRCPSCETKDQLTSLGAGVERVAEAVTTAWPQARIFVATATSLASRAAQQDFVTRMQDGQIDLLIGTQIIAKGYDFQNLALAGIIDGDSSLDLGDFRAGEQCWQLINQVAGRTGRGDHQGRALVQTYNPGDSLLQALVSGDRQRFLETELNRRKRGKWPPFYRLAALLIEGGDSEQVERFAVQLLQKAPAARDEDIELLGPAPATLMRLRGQWRWRFLLRARKRSFLDAWLDRWLPAQTPSGIRIKLDIDPYQLL